VVTTTTGTGIGAPLFDWTAAGLAFALLGTERIRIVALFGLLAVVLVVVLEARVPYSTGALSPTKLFWGAFVPVAATTLFALMRPSTTPFDLPSGRRRRWRGTNEVIQDKTRQLEIANKHKLHLIASASHDLRQPLHALNLFVAQLRDEPDPTKRDLLVGRIDASVTSMNELFESLLDMTKLDAGIVDPSPTEFRCSTAQPCSTDSRKSPAQSRFKSGARSHLYRTEVRIDHRAHKA